VRTYESGCNPVEVWIPSKKRGYCYQLIEAPTYFNVNLKAQKVCFLAYLQLAPEKIAPCEVRSLEDYFELPAGMNNAPAGNIFISYSTNSSSAQLTRKRSSTCPATRTQTQVPFFPILVHEGPHCTCSLPRSASGSCLLSEAPRTR
jgi:hypothetical protein